MPNTRWTGGVVPTVDDNLIEAWDAYDDSAGRVMPAASVAAARVMLAAAPSGAVSKARPAVFIIDDILYTADGSKGGDGSFNINPANSFSGVLYRHRDNTNGRGRPTSDHTTYTWGDGIVTLPIKSLMEFSLDVCVSIAHEDYHSEEEKDKAVGSYFFGFKLDNRGIWQTEIQYNRTFMTHHMQWRLSVEAGSHRVAYTTAGSYGADPYWHYDGGVFPGTVFTVATLGATRVDL